MTHETTDYIGHVCYAFILVGMYLLSKKKPIGWVFRLIGEIGWLGLGIVTGFTSIWFWGCIFVAMDLVGYRSWKKEEKKS